MVKGQNTKNGNCPIKDNRDLTEISNNGYNIIYNCLRFAYPAEATGGSEAGGSVPEESWGGAWGSWGGESWSWRFLGGS